VEHGLEACLTDRLALDPAEWPRPPLQSIVTEVLFLFGLSGSKVVEQQVEEGGKDDPFIGIADQVEWKRVILRPRNQECNLA